MNIRRLAMKDEPGKEKDRWLKFFLAGLATIDTVFAILTFFLK